MEEYRGTAMLHWALMMEGSKVAFLISCFVESEAARVSSPLNRDFIYEKYYCQVTSSEQFVIWVDLLIMCLFFLFFLFLVFQ